MAFQQALEDKNQVFALIGHSGTADSAETRRIVVTEEGAVAVDLVGTEPVIVQIGTVTVGTIDLLKAGTLNTLGTVGQLTNGSLVVTNGTIGAGTVLTLDSLAPGKYDYINAGYPDGTTETYTYKNGGSGGATIAILTVIYTDSTKGSISSIASV